MILEEVQAKFPLEKSVEEIDNLNIKEASLLAMKRAILGLKKII